MARNIAIAGLVLFLATSSAVQAQTPPPDPIRDALIAPDVVMSHQQELRLSDAQRSVILSDVSTAQEHFLRAQRQLEAAVGKLVDILRQSRIDQNKALAQMDAVLDIEREIKRAQLTLMLQVKNELTEEQQAAAKRLEAGSKP